MHKIYIDTQIESKYQKALEFYNKNGFNYAAKYFYELGNYQDSEKLYKDSLQKYEEALERQRLAEIEAEKRKKEELYQKAVRNFNQGEYIEAYKYFSENLE